MRACTQSAAHIGTALDDNRSNPRNAQSCVCNFARCSGGRRGAAPPGSHLVLKVLGRRGQLIHLPYAVGQGVRPPRPPCTLTLWQPCSMPHSGVGMRSRLRPIPPLRVVKLARDAQSSPAALGTDYLWRRPPANARARGGEGGVVEPPRLTGVGLGCMSAKTACVGTPACKGPRTLCFGWLFERCRQWQRRQGSRGGRGPAHHFGCMGAHYRLFQCLVRRRFAQPAARLPLSCRQLSCRVRWGHNYLRLAEFVDWICFTYGRSSSNHL
jgi:hypothetical protein